jgi:hypothetical protein
VQRSVCRFLLKKNKSRSLTAFGMTSLGAFSPACSDRPAAERRRGKIRVLSETTLADARQNQSQSHKLYRKLNLDFPFYLRFSLCAPQDKYWGTAIYQEQSLGHEIDRTLRLIVALNSRCDVTALPSPARAKLPARGAWEKAKRAGEAALEG